MPLETSVSTEEMSQACLSSLSGSIQQLVVVVVLARSQAKEPDVVRATQLPLILMHVLPEKCILQVVLFMVMARSQAQGAG
jgi:hypothetical protein